MSALAVWLAGFAATMVFATHRLRVNARRGLIANPTDPLAFCHMTLLVLVAWPLILWRAVR